MAYKYQGNAEDNTALYFTNVQAHNFYNALAS